MNEEVYMTDRDIFVYHLDNGLQKLFSLNRYDDYQLYKTFKTVTRVAFLVCKERILIPASNYFESNLAHRILDELKELNEIGSIILISSSTNIDELIKKKATQHGESLLIPSYHYQDFININDERKIILPGTLKKREGSASLDIKSA